MTMIDLVHEGRTVQRLLADTKHSVTPLTRSTVERLSGTMCRVAGYHFGWLDEQGQPISGQGGKAIRPAFTLVSAIAVGGTVANAVPAAVAVELAHNFSLLHDDVMDGDRMRRHRPTAWAVFGIPAAILTGDGLLSLAFEVLTSTGPARYAATRLLNNAVRDLIDGQSLDMDFEQRNHVGISECGKMAAAKTGALLGCSCALGALLGGGTSHQIDRLRAFGEQLGLAFQLVDDLLGIWGDPEKTGKPVYSDLANRKKSLPVVAALTAGGPAADELAELYRLDRPLAQAELAQAAELVDAAGGRGWAQAQARDTLARALEHLDSAGVGRQAAAELRSLAELICRRDY